MHDRMIKQRSRNHGRLDPIWKLLLVLKAVSACTDILVTPGASTDSSAMIAYNADSPSLFGVVYHYPAVNQSNGKDNNNNNNNNNNNGNGPTKMRKIYDWDSGVYLGEIAEANQTYHVVGNTNEHGLVIGESTFGGIAYLQQTDGILDYGSLIYVTLQRSKTCREAIHVMNNLLDTYGYYSEGESFSLADYYTGEVWMMELVGRGMTYGKKGAVWVAQRIPDGMVAAHANQARIRTFNRNDPHNFLYAPDVVDVAIHYGLYPANADPLDFSFSDVYGPLDFLNARQGEARVWSIFSQIVDPAEQFQANYQLYALGENLTHRMPLYVRPYRKLSAMDVMNLMASHYEGTPLDSSVDVGAGLFASPYRPRPLVWEWNGTTYHNERSIATAKTGWSFVAQIRPWMPPPLSGLIWFACDDSSTAPRAPIYSASTRIAKPYAGQGTQDGVLAPLLQFDLTKAFWVQNMVSNFAYSRWKDVYPQVRHKIQTIQRRFESMVAATDQRALELYQSSGDEINGLNEAVECVTKFSVVASNQLHQQWLAFYGELFVQFRDMYTIVPKPEDPACGCEISEPGLSEETKRRIVTETGDHYKVLGSGDVQPDIVRGEMDFTTRQPTARAEPS
ncbi:hypothetical protein ACA910_010856 [Epithemia clementina (nom. ined.)]